LGLLDEHESLVFLGLVDECEGLAPGFLAEGLLGGRFVEPAEPFAAVEPA
jgi:hypothetical protein